jgi:hypothetical protein
MYEVKRGNEMAKRSQLEVGQEWAYHRERKHGHIAYGGYYKVVIESVEPHEQNRYGGGVRKSNSGLGVLVSVHEKWQGEIRINQKVVQLSQLWKPWAEYEVAQAEYLVQYKISQEKAKVAKAEGEKYKQEVYNPAYKEFIKLIAELSGGKYVSGWTRIEELPIEVLQGVVKLAQEKAVA